MNQIYTLPKLPYAYNALEPYVDAKTMEIHHTKHHQAYIDKLNTALEKHPELLERPLDDLLANPQSIPEDIRIAVQNNGGGHLNHSFFWNILSPKAKRAPEGELLTTIEKTFGSFEDFKKKFEEAALGRFGSGWVWLAADTNKNLNVYSTPNQDSPVMRADKPIIGVDVWEHAYYLTYQNKRGEYVSAMWNAIDWSVAEELYVHI